MTRANGADPSQKPVTNSTTAAMACFVAEDYKVREGGIVIAKDGC